METDPQSILNWPDNTYNKKSVDNSVKNTKNENVYNQKNQFQAPTVINNHYYGNEGSLWWEGAKVKELEQRISELENENASLKRQNEDLRKVAVGNKRLRLQLKVEKSKLSTWIKSKLSKNTA